MKKTKIVAISAGLLLSSSSAFAVISGTETNACAISYADFVSAVQTAYVDTNGNGFGLPMWATLMNSTGKVCHVTSVKGVAGTANGGLAAGRNAWLGSRVISAQKANTANAFSLNGLAISTGAISATVYPGGSLYGLQHSNPVDTNVVYAGGPANFGTSTDPLAGTFPGGVNVFGGGVALYNSSGVKAGSVGVSGDTSCRDHTMAYRLRIALTFNNEPNDDGLTLVDTTAGPLTGLFQQPACGVNDPAVTVYQASDDNGIR